MGALDYPRSYKGGDTRREAYEAATVLAADVRERCLSALEDAALTADEVAERTGDSILTIRPRMTELKQQGRIVKTPLRRRNKSGKSATVWMLVDPL